MQKIRWGVLSTAKIARTQVIPAIQSSSLGEVVAIASRREAQAAEQARALGIATAYGRYEDLLADPNVDAIYNPLPNHLHVPWSIKALEAGKHVLVEKPAGLNSRDLEPLLSAAARYPDLKLMEAFMYRFHPQWQKTQQLCQNTIGPLRSIQCAFSYNNRDPHNIRYSAAMGGGALMDIGCYGISLARYLFDAEPLQVSADMAYLGGAEVDTLTSAQMVFDGGTASFSCSTQIEATQWVEAIGEAGRVRIEVPFNPVGDAETRLTLTQNGKSETLTIGPANHYRAMADTFADAIRHNKPAPTPLTDTRANMKVLDAVVESAKDKRWVEL